MGSEMLPLVDVCQTITDGSHYSPKYVPGTEYYMASVRDMGDFGFDFSNCKTISKEDYKVMQRNGCCPEKGDILIGKDGANFYMDAFIFDQEERPAILSSIAILKPNERIVVPEFLFAYLRTPAVASDVRANYKSGSAIQRIVLKDFKRLPIWVPDIATQAHIANIYTAFNRLIRINQQTNDYLAEMCEAIAGAMDADGTTILADISSQVTAKVACEESTIENYVSTESLLPDKGGRQIASALPATGKVTVFHPGDTLVSNIRPYFKKVWYADREGTCSGDVIVFRAKEPELAPYLHSVLRSDGYFEHVMAGAKGTKMPRGDKSRRCSIP